MNLKVTIVVLAALAMGCTSAEEFYAANETAKEREKKEAGAAADERVAKSAGYQEMELDGRLIVVGTDSAAERVRSGEKPPYTVIKTGFGPKGETVVFEAGKDASAMEQKLMAEYKRRHPKQ